MKEGEELPDTGQPAHVKRWDVSSQHPVGLLYVVAYVFNWGVNSACSQLIIWAFWKTWEVIICFAPFSLRISAACQHSQWRTAPPVIHRVCSEPQIVAVRPDVFSPSLQLNSNIAQFERDQESTVLIRNIHEYAPWKARNHTMCQSGQDSFFWEEGEEKGHFKWVTRYTLWEVLKWNRKDGVEGMIWTASQTCRNKNLKDSIRGS